MSGSVDTFADKFTAPVRASEILSGTVRLENERALICRGICLCIVVRVHPVSFQFGPRPKIGITIYTLHYLSVYAVSYSLKATERVSG